LSRSARAAEVKAALAEALADWAPEEVERHLERGPDGFWLSADLESHERWARLMREADRQKRPLTVETRIARFQAVTEVVVFTADHPGLFSRLAGAIAASGGSIVNARIFTTNDGMALDVFWIQDLEGKAFDRADRLARLSATVERTLFGEIKLTQELPKRRGNLPARAEVFTVEPRVLVDNNASNTHTVIEVNGRDRPALLYDLTRALFGLSLSISQARIATYGERAVDVFYVKDLFGLKIESESRLQQIRARLLEALKPPPPASRAAAE
jgi:[protein-PII] uridylyltransferase